MPSFLRHMKDQNKKVANLKHNQQLEKKKNAQLLEEVRRREDSMVDNSQHMQVSPGLASQPLHIYRWIIYNQLCRNSCLGMVGLTFTWVWHLGDMLRKSNKPVLVESIISEMMFKKRWMWKILEVLHRGSSFLYLPLKGKDCSDRVGKECLFGIVFKLGGFGGRDTCRYHKRHSDTFLWSPFIKSKAPK